MIYKTSELIGAKLDAAVAMAEGLESTIAPYRVSDGYSGITFVRDEPVCIASGDHFEPSVSWRYGGPIIERKHIAVMLDDPSGKNWCAIVGAWMCHDLVADGRFDSGPTPLIASMRALVRSELGDEVEIPE